MKRIAIIMAGGVGERFWPLSRKAYPKQLLKIDNECSMLHAAVSRIGRLAAPEDIYIFTTRPLKSAIVAEITDIPAANVIAEPEGKNTAACLALASAFVEKKYAEDVVMLVVTADHFIRDVEAFQSDFEAATRFAEANPALVTFGIRPTRPETGYGYIEVGEPASECDPIFKVTSYREKPDNGTARRFLEEGGFVWNSGMFVWKNSILREGLRKHLPAIYSRMKTMEAAFADPDSGEELDKAYASLEKISIDVGLLERADNVNVIRASFDWDDVGTWSSLARLLEKDSAGNVVFGNSVLLKSQNSIMYAMDGENAAVSRRLVIGYNLEGIVVVSTPEAVLVLPASDVQNVKDVVAYLREAELDHYL